jgi:signal transduction histidine kinase
VEVEIADKGKGIPPEKQRDLATAKAGVGMRGMQERVRQLGGTFKITSNGKGTCVAVVFPIAQHVAVA